MSSAIPKIRFRDPQIEMAHGAGGKASRRLVEGLFAPILYGASQEPLGDAALVNLERNARRDYNRQFCGEAAALFRRVDRRAGGKRHSERSGCFGRSRGSPGGDLYPGSGLAVGRAGSGSAGHGQGCGARGRANSGRRYESGGAREGRPHVHYDGGDRAAYGRRHDFGEVGTAGRPGAAERADWRSRHHHSAGAR